jgi:transcriptional regulator with XRE-family HTH domain
MLRENYVGKQQRIGQRLTRAIAKAHMDRRELAELTGYSEAQIVRWELGRAPLYPIELVKLCHALDVRPEWLLCWERRVHTRTCKPQTARAISAPDFLRPCLPDAYRRMGLLASRAKTKQFQSLITFVLLT